MRAKIVPPRARRGGNARLLLGRADAESSIYIPCEKAADARRREKKNAQDAGTRGKNDGNRGSRGKGAEGGTVERDAGVKVGKANFVTACDSPEARGASGEEESALKDKKLTDRVWTIIISM